MSKVYYPAARAILQVIFDGYGETARDSERKIINVIPSAAKITGNSYRQADSWELTFDADDLPIDPRQIRNGAAEIYLFQMPGLSADSRSIDRQFAGIEDPAALKNRNPVDVVAAEQQFMGHDKFTFGAHPKIAGLFDDHSVQMDESGKWVTIQGQDYTALLHNKQWPPNPNGTARRIPTGRRIDDLLRDLLREVDTENVLDLKVDVSIPDRELPTVGAQEIRTNHRGIPIEQQTSYWDVMYKIATRYSFILFVQGFTVWLSRPKNLDDRVSTDIKQLAWGQNLTSLRMSRHLGKEKVPRIIIKSYDHINRKNITVEYPGSRLERTHKDFKLDSKTNKAKATEKIGGQPKTKKSKTKPAPLHLTDEYEIIPVYGITDVAVLKAAAETLYHLRGHGERTVVATTRDLTDMDESSLMDLSAGDAVSVEFLDFDPDFQKYLGDASNNEEAKIQALVARGYGEDIARELARNFTTLMGDRRPLRVREVTYDWSVEKGLDVELELVDFVVVDGIRDPDERPRTVDKRKHRMLNKDGKPIGGDPAVRK